MKINWLPIDDPRHTEVLGYRVSSKIGRNGWNELDWSVWWIDGPEPHIFNSGGSYLHVMVKHDPEQDGPDEKDRRHYRVRCWYAGGEFRGKDVQRVGIGFCDGKLHWIVGT